MEIGSFRSLTNFLFKGNSKNTKLPEVPAFKEKSQAESFADVRRKAGAVDFTRITRVNCAPSPAIITAPASVDPDGYQRYRRYQPCGG